VDSRRTDLTDSIRIERFKGRTAAIPEISQEVGLIAEARPRHVSKCLEVRIRGVDDGGAEIMSTQEIGKLVERHA